MKYKKISISNSDMTATFELTEATDWDNIFIAGGKESLILDTTNGVILIGPDVKNKSIITFHN